jgi:signal transduction histidine kinase
MLAKSPFKIFYLVFAYILAFSVWWAYLLFDKNETAFNEKIELNKINFETKNVSKSLYVESAEYKLILEKYKRQKVMILSEGSFFILLLVLGLLQVRRTFKREIELAEQQRNFLLSITHELKSPLSSVKLSLQTMMKRVLEPEQKDKLLSNSISDVVRLESLVDNILFAAKIERNAHGFSNEDLNLSELTVLVIEKFLLNKKNIALKSSIQDSVYFNTDRMGYTSVLINLVENAIKYSDENSEVTIVLSDDETNIFLEVKDKGYGIPKEEKEKVFDKFYRVGNEDTRKSKGTGLGLYIVKRFVEIYNGTVELTDNIPNGSIFKITFPKL